MTFEGKVYDLSRKHWVRWHKLLSLELTPFAFMVRFEVVWVRRRLSRSMIGYMLFDYIIHDIIYIRYYTTYYMRASLTTNNIMVTCG